MNTIETLTTATQEFKAEFIANTTAWATAEFSKMMDMLTWGAAEWCKALGIEARNNGGVLEFPKGFYVGKDYVRLDKMKGQAIVAKRMGVEAFITRSIETAEKHYTDSIAKLAAAIEKKGLGQNIEVKACRVGVNLEATITDGIKTVNAYTIIAEGQVQRPHYRYLVK